MIKLKRIYEKPSADDGERILVERLWARGITKEAARLDQWMKEIAPSTELRKWYGHEVERWPEFQKRYREELRAADKQELIQDLRRRARSGTVTLVYAAHDEEHNGAVVLQQVLEGKHGSA